MGYESPYGRSDQVIGLTGVRGCARAVGELNGVRDERCARRHGFVPNYVAGMNGDCGADRRRTRLRQREALGAGLRFGRTQRLRDAGRVVQVADFVDDALDLREPENKM